MQVVKGGLDGRLDAVFANDAGNPSFFEPCLGLWTEMSDVDLDASSVVCHHSRE